MNQYLLIVLLIPISFAYADFNDPTYTQPPLRSDQLPCNIGSSPDENYFQYQCEWIENPIGGTQNALELFQQIHNRILLEIKTLKVNPGLHEFQLTSFKDEYVDRLVFTQRITDNTTLSMTLYNGTVSNPVIIADGVNNVLNHLNKKLGKEATESMVVKFPPDAMVDCVEGYQYNGTSCIPEPDCPSGTKLKNGACNVIDMNASPFNQRDCLIATASYGSELASQVQMLREIRDNTLLNTESGKIFMQGFNTVYYSFSPQIAELENENHVFRETVKLFITPMITTLSIMTLADDSDLQVILFGASAIGIIVGMYVVAPVVTANYIWKKRK